MPRGGARPGAGRPKDADRPVAPDSIKGLAREHAPEAIATVLDVMKRGPHREKLAAAKLLLAYAYGAPATAVEVSGPDRGPIATYNPALLADDETRELLINLARRVESGAGGDGDPP